MMSRAIASVCLFDYAIDDYIRGDLPHQCKRKSLEAVYTTNIYKMSTWSAKKAVFGKKSNLLKKLSSSKESLLEVTTVRTDSGSEAAIDAQMQRIKEQLSKLRLQRTDLKRGIENVNSNLADLRGEYATRVSLSGSISDLSSVAGSMASLVSDGSSCFSDCYLIEDEGVTSDSTRSADEDIRPTSSSSIISESYEDRIEASSDMLKDQEFTYL